MSIESPYIATAGHNNYYTIGKVNRTSMHAFSKGSNIGHFALFLNVVLWNFNEESKDFDNRYLIPGNTA